MKKIILTSALLITSLATITASDYIDNQIVKPIFNPDGSLAKDPSEVFLYDKRNVSKSKGGDKDDLLATQDGLGVLFGLSKKRKRRY